MKKKIVWIVLAVVLVAVLAAASVLYPRLSAKVVPGAPADSAPTQSAEAMQTESTDAASIQTAADFFVQDDNGNTDALSAHFGKPIVVNFWATWCGYCVEELPYFNAAAEKYADTVDFMMVDLTDGERETIRAARAFVEKNGFTFPVYYDTTSSAGDAYALYSIPMTLFIAPDGTIRNSCIGAVSSDVLEQNIQALLQ